MLMISQLKKIVGAGILYFDLREKVFSFPPLHMLLVTGLCTDALLG